MPAPKSHGGMTHLAPRAALPAPLRARLVACRCVLWGVLLLCGPCSARTGLSKLANSLGAPSLSRNLRPHKANEMLFARTESATPLKRIFFGSCSDQRIRTSFWESHPGRLSTDLTLMTGDLVYGRCREAGCNDLAVAYQNLSAIESFQRFRQEQPMLAVWDDNDMGKPDGGSSFPWKEDAKKLFLDYFNIPLQDPRRTSGRGMYSSYSIGPPGQNVQILLLDTRYHRSDLLPAYDAMFEAGNEEADRKQYNADPDPSKTMLGDDQWMWLTSELQRPADLRILVSSIQVISRAHKWEKWGNLPHERDRLIKLLSSASPPPLIVSGDRHVGGLYNSAGSASLTESVGGTPKAGVLWEMTSSSLTHTRSCSDKFQDLQDPDRLGPLVMENNVGVIDIDWAARTASVELQSVGGAEPGRQLGERLACWPLASTAAI